MAALSLYTYFRSSAAHRVRIALHLKGVAYTPRFVHLTRGGGEHLQADYLDLNPQGLVPTLVHDGRAFTQSLAIVEYLDECYPDPPLLPREPADRAYVRSLAQLVACDIHPLNNLRVLSYLRQTLGHGEPVCRQWYQHWVEEGLAAFEALLGRQPPGRFCHGETPTLADLCLVPQLYNARRFECRLAPFHRILAIEERCKDLPPFREAAPEHQQDSR